MKFKDLKIIKSPPVNYDLEGEQRFIYQYGLFNCKVLKFMPADNVIDTMNRYDPDCLTTKDKEFIQERSHKEVLCYISYGYEKHPDIFVYGDDNIAFTPRCFV